MRRNGRRPLVPLLAGALLLSAAVPAFALPAALPVPGEDDAIEAAMKEYAEFGTINGEELILGEFDDNSEVCPLPENDPSEQIGDSDPATPDMITPEERALINEGRRLFFSRTDFGQQPSLGPNESVFGEILSCADCHTGSAFSDNETHVIGPTEHRELVPRQTQHLLNLENSEPFTWDGRFACMQAQMKSAIETPLEMRASREPTQAELDALKAFVETLDIPDARPGIDFDPALAARGEVLFNEERGRDPFGRSLPGQQISCASCHLPEQKFTDEDFHIVLLPLFVTPDIDPIDPLHIEGDRVQGANTPILRGLRLTAPYFHDGLAGDPSGEDTFVNRPADIALLQVVAFYSERFEFDFTIGEQLAIVEFLKSV
jgi:hypothetical protein